MQSVVAGHETAVKSPVAGFGVITGDHVPFPKLRKFPFASTARQLPTAAHDMPASGVPLSTAWGADHVEPFQLRALP
jgi:hypothetical protein